MGIFIQQLPGYNLIKAGFPVEYGDSGEQAQEIIKNSCRISTFLTSSCRRGRKRAVPDHAERQPVKRIPIILLTPKGEVSDIVGWLDHGADDYITKPLNSQNSYLSNYKN